MSLAGRITLIFRDFTKFRGKYTPQLIMAAQYEATKAGVTYLYPKLVRATPVGATAMLRQSTLFTPPRYTMSSTEGRVGWEVSSTIGATGGASLYVEFVEHGRRPGKFPPVDPIRKWVRRVLGITGASQIRSVAFLVARKIARNGTPATNFTRITAEKEEQTTKMFMKMAASRVLNNPPKSAIHTVERKGG